MPYFFYRPLPWSQTMCERNSQNLNALTQVCLIRFQRMYLLWQVMSLRNTCHVFTNLSNCSDNIKIFGREQFLVPMRFCVTPPSWIILNFLSGEDVEGFGLLGIEWIYSHLKDHSCPLDWPFQYVTAKLSGVLSSCHPEVLGLIPLLYFLVHSHVMNHLLL